MVGWTLFSAVLGYAFLSVAGRSFLESTTPLLVSAVLSGVAIVLAVLSVVLPRRR
jgi:hypothetical protein